MTITLSTCLITLTNNSKKLWCVGSFLFFCGVLAAQNSQNRLPLVSILNTIQSQFPYTFTYADDVVFGKEALFPPDTSSFNVVLTYLEKETGLTFTVVDDSFVAITAKRKVLFCGYIKSFDDKFPIANCLVKSENTSVTTDDKGYFELTLSKNRELLTIQSPGYEILHKPSYTLGTACGTIYLNPTIEKLPEVILKNYLTTGIDKTFDGNFLLDLEKFDILPGVIETDVLKTIQALPGIQSANETVSNINIRGGTHDQNLILWDGIKMYQSGHFFGLISAFDPNSTKTVRLFKNGTDPAYTDGVSGTILMETDDTITSDFLGSWSINQINTSGFLDIPIGKKSSLQLSGRKAINELIETSTYSQFFKRTLQNTELIENDEEVTNSDIQFDFHDTSLRWLYAITEKDQLRINFIHIDNELKFTEAANVAGINTSKESNLKQSSLAFGLNYQREWSKQWQTSLSIYDTSYLLESINVNILDDLAFFQSNKVAETSAKVQVTYRINQSFSLNSGYQWLETAVSDINELGVELFRERRDRVIRSHSIFSNLQYQSNSSNTRFKTGFRYQYNEKFATYTLEPRWSLYQKVAPNWALEFSGEFKNQYTAHNINFQTDFLGVEKRRWVLSDNEGLPIVKAKQVSTGVHFDKRGWLFSTEGYYKKVSGINTKSQGFLNQYSSENEVGSYTTYGIDILINKSIGNFRIWNNYMWAQNDYTFDSLEDKNFPNTIDIRHAVTLGTSYTLKSFKMAMGLNWRSALPTTRPIVGDEVRNGIINYEAAHASRITNYLRYDVSATYAFLLRKGIKMHTGFSVWNLLNKRNILKEYYQLDANEDLQRELEQALGITPNFFLKVAF